MTNDLNTYDLVVIGGGLAGITAATVASSFRKSVALVDSHQEIGGAGVNTGTVPSKTLRETALALSGLKSRNLYGVDLSSGRSEVDRRAYHGRPRDGGRAHRSGGHDVQCLSESLCRRLLQPADSRNALQNRNDERTPKRSVFRESCLIERTA